VASLLGLFTADERAMALQRAGTLSGGQQQRVAICRALMQEPRLMLADEPIASLDPRNARMVMDMLRRIHWEDGLTVLVNLHHLDTARHYCECIVALSAGRVVFNGTPAERVRVRVRVRDVYGGARTSFMTMPGRGQCRCGRRLPSSEQRPAGHGRV
ncbi:MAG: ATP-binding cassette domain-containing protein, partial [Janthinobacterium lividum]